MLETKRSSLRHFVSARLIDRSVWSALILLDETVGEQVGFDFLAADVGKHLAIDFNARAEHLAALFDHFLALVGIVDDVTIFERQFILAHDGADALAPATTRFQVSDNLRFLHRKKLTTSCHRTCGAQVLPTEAKFVRARQVAKEAFGQFLIRGQHVDAEFLRPFRAGEFTLQLFQTAAQPGVMVGLFGEPFG
ncbi:MAG: hypothetical protein JWO95_1748 [Verrucomicrobiales bacterium]|nr:hypothetical protein [Verrucomicrobiales bacterium]